MKTLFIPAKVKYQLNKQKLISISKKLPKNLAIVYSIQYENLAKNVKEIFSQKHKITKLAQVLGCTKLNFSKNTQAILLITDGKFHAVSLAYETKLPVFIFENNNLEKISEEDMKKFEARQKSAYLNFLNEDKIGILVSTKQRQQNFKKAIEFKKKTKNKKLYLFLANNVNPDEFQNFGLKIWVNTACPRLDMEGLNIVNISRL